MRNDKTRQPGKAESQTRAEEDPKQKGKKRQADTGERRAQEEMQRLVHELRVHQIELEVQNDELRAIQASVEEARSRYEDLYDFSPLGYFTFDRKGLIRAMNLRGARLLGKERKLSIDSPFPGFMDSKSLKVFFSHLEQVFAGDTKQNCELWLKTGEGSHVPVVMESIRTEERPGSIGQCQSAVLDITKRKQAEEALRVSEERLNLALTASAMGVWEWDIEPGTIFWSPECFKITDVNGFGGRLADFTEALHPEDAARVRTAIDKALAEKTVFKEEFRIIRPDGEVRWLSDLGRTTYDENGKPLRMTGTVQDITPRKLIEEVLQQAERYQHLAAEILGILNDPSTLDESINLILAAIKRKTGFDAVGIRLRRGDDFPYAAQNGFSPDFLLTENTLVARNPNSGPRREANGRISLECTCGLVISGQTDPANPFFTKGGSFWTNNSLPLLDLTAEQDPRLHPRNTCIHRGYLSAALIPIRVNREIVGLLQLNDRRKDRFTHETIHLFEGIAASIGTALIRKQTQEVVEERTEQLEEINKELESFSYSVSHDLRAPLRAIDGYARMILRRKGEQFDEETRRQFDQIRDNTRMMEQLIDDILAFSRLGKREMAVSRIDMDELVKEVWESLRKNNPDRQFNVRMDRLPPGMGDRVLITQVLTNLLSNAIKYSGTRDVPLVEVGGYAEESETVYYVKDNGVGFDMAYYHKLFGVFQRLHGADEFEGTGVGLAIVQRIIHRHGGRTWAEGKVDGGRRSPSRCPGK